MFWDYFSPKIFFGNGSRHNYFASIKNTEKKIFRQGI